MSYAIIMVNFILQCRNKVVEFDLCLLKDVAERRSLNRPMSRHGYLKRFVRKFPLHANVAAALANNDKSQPLKGGHYSVVTLGWNLWHDESPFLVRSQCNHTSSMGPQSCDCGKRVFRVNDPYSDNASMRPHRRARTSHAFDPPSGSSASADPHYKTL